MFVPRDECEVTEGLSGGASLQAPLAVEALRRGLQQLALFACRRLLLLFRLLRLFLPLKKGKGKGKGTGKEKKKEKEKGKEKEREKERV